MELKNVYDPTVLNELLGRLNNLKPESQRVWGKMDSGQMLAHCAKVLEVATGNVKASKRPLAGYILGPFIKPLLTNNKPFKQGNPTGPDFLITEEKDFHSEKERLADVLTRFSQGGPGAMANTPHPFFGKFTPDNWSRSTYKHIDHHFRQFGV